MNKTRMSIVVGAGALGLLVAGVVASHQVGAQQSKLSNSVIGNLGKQIDAGFTQKSPFQTDLPDHVWVAGTEYAGNFLHFDKPAGEATRVLYTGTAIKGRWCAEDQARIEAVAGKGFTHFHRTAKVATADAGHGGAKAGESGYWLKHVAVGPAFKMPWGDVAPGATDLKFMPTAAPKCGS